MFQLLQNKTVGSHTRSRQNTSTHFGTKPQFLYKNNHNNVYLIACFLPCLLLKVHWSKISEFPLLWSSPPIGFEKDARREDMRNLGNTIGDSPTESERVPGAEQTSGWLSWPVGRAVPVPGQSWTWRNPHPDTEPTLSSLATQRGHTFNYSNTIHILVLCSDS